MIGPALIVALLLWSAIGHAKPLPCDNLCTAAQLAADERLQLTTDLGPHQVGKVIAE